MQNNKLKTHEVLDLHYHADEGQGCFVGTKEECEEFAATQSPSFMYKVVPMIIEEVRNYPDNNWYFKDKNQRDYELAGLINRKIK